ncbi:MAG TPA: cation diffusion facilitator family transporter [Polyangia bacterium]|jgi:cation diffusion facilitator family transporter|nr:cation diffusion facilitator family transporter [Polyangia bacterium]
MGFARQPPPGEGESLRTVVIALVANAGIAAAKFVAALLTRSSAMLAEAIHATADTGNQVLLLLADRLARRPPDETHPIGHGREAYFWALVAALGMFMTGALLAVRQGIMELFHPVRVSSPLAAYVVLGIAFCLDGVSLMRAYRQLKTEATRLDLQFLEHFDRSSDPVGRAVFAEDAVAMVGNVVAFAGIVLDQVTGSAIPDAAGALVIGLCLAIVALDLTRRNRDFLVGRQASTAVRDALCQLISRRPGVTAVDELWVTFVGPRRLWVVARIQTDDTLDGPALKRLLRTIEQEIQAQSTSFERVYLVPS